MRRSPKLLALLAALLALSSRAQASPSPHCESLLSGHEASMTSIETVTSAYKRMIKIALDGQLSLEDLKYMLHHDPFTLPTETTSELEALDQGLSQLRAYARKMNVYGPLLFEKIKSELRASLNLGEEITKQIEKEVEKREAPSPPVLLTFKEESSNAVFSKDGHIAVTHFDDPSKQLSIFSTESGSLQQILTLESSRGSIEFTPDNRFVIQQGHLGALGYGYGISIWDLKTSKLAYTITENRDNLGFVKRFLGVTEVEPKDKITVAKVTPDGRFIITGSREGNLWIRRFSNGKVLYKLKTGNPNSVRELSISDDGKTIVTVHASKNANGPEIQLWDLRDRSIESRFYPTQISSDGKTKLGGFSEVTVSPNARTAILRSFGNASVIDLRTQRIRFAIEKANLQASYSPDSRFILVPRSNEEDLEVFDLWNTITGEVRSSLEFPWPIKNVHQIDFSPDGKTVYLKEGPKRILVLPLDSLD